MERLKEKLDFLLDKYSVGEKVILKDRKTALFGGKEVPLLPHRAERRYIELRNIVTGGTLEGVSMMKCECVAKKTSGVYDVLRREADIASFVLGRRIKSVAAAENENTLNAIAKTEDGVVIIFEIAATLSDEESEKCKHEVTSRRGTASDILVDAQLHQDSVYVFGEKNEKYTDVDFELYGLSEEEISTVRAAFDLAKNKNYDENIKAFNEAEKIAQLAKRSAMTGEREVL